MIILTFEKLKELNEELKKIKETEGDIGMLKFAQKHSDIVNISLDNDSARLDFIQVSEEKNLSEEEVDDLVRNYWFSFDKDFGNREGVYTLFEMLGIRAEPV